MYIEPALQFSNVYVSNAFFILYCTLEPTCGVSDSLGKQYIKDLLLFSMFDTILFILNITYFMNQKYFFFFFACFTLYDKCCNNEIFV